MLLACGWKRECVCAARHVSVHTNMCRVSVGTLRACVAVRVGVCLYERV